MFTYTSRKGQYTVVGMVPIQSLDWQPIEGVVVSAEWALGDQSTVSQQATTNRRGVATYTVKGGGGKYDLHVSDAAGL